MADHSTGLRDTFFQFVRILGPSLALHRGRLGLALLLSVISTCCGILGPLSIQWIIDGALPARDMGRFLSLCAMAVAAFTLSHAVWAVHLVLARRACEDVIHHFKERIATTILVKEPRFFRRYKTGDVLTRMVGDMEDVSLALYENLLLGIALSLYSVLVMVFILIWDWRLGLVLLLSLPLYLAVVIGLDGPLTRLTARARRLLSEQADLFLDLIVGQSDIRVTQRQNAFVRRFSDSAGEVGQANARCGVFAAMALNATSLLGTLIAALPFMIGGYFMIHGGDVTLGVLVAIYTLMTLVTSNMLDLMEKITDLVQARPALMRLAEVLEYPEQPTPPAPRLDRLPERMRLEFRDVQFGYNEGELLLHGANLIIEEDERVALIGASGSGKSTLAGLAMRNHSAWAGQVLLDGVPIGELPLALYLSQIGYVGQDTHLFRMSVFENVAMGWPGVDEGDVERMLRIVSMDEIVGALPQGMHTPLGAGGVALSGGQKQRLCLARALIREPRLLILDEFTSALDKTTERALLVELLEKGLPVGILCITHSPEAAECFDRIVTLRDGAIHGETPAENQVTTT